MHAKEGQLPDGWVEVMGLMTGRIDGDTMIVMDAYALPVQGEAAFVTAQGQANEYMVRMLTSRQQV